MFLCTVNLQQQQQQLHKEKNCNYNSTVGEEMLKKKYSFHRFVQMACRMATIFRYFFSIRFNVYIVYGNEVMENLFYMMMIICLLL